MANGLDSVFFLAPQGGFHSGWHAAHFYPLSGQAASEDGLAEIRVCFAHLFEGADVLCEALDAEQEYLGEVVIRVGTLFRETVSGKLLSGLCVAASTDGLVDRFNCGTDEGVLLHLCLQGPHRCNRRPPPGHGGSPMLHAARWRLTCSDDPLLQDNYWGWVRAFYSTEEGNLEGGPLEPAARSESPRPSVEGPLASPGREASRCPSGESRSYRNRSSRGARRSDRRRKDNRQRRSDSRDDSRRRGRLRRSPTPRPRSRTRSRKRGRRGPERDFGEDEVARGGDARAPPPVALKQLEGPADQGRKPVRTRPRGTGEDGHAGVGPRGKGDGRGQKEPPAGRARARGEEARPGIGAGLEAALQHGLVLGRDQARRGAPAARAARDADQGQEGRGRREAARGGGAPRGDKERPGGERGRAHAVVGRRKSPRAGGRPRRAEAEPRGRDPRSRRDHGASPLPTCIARRS